MFVKIMADIRNSYQLFKRGQKKHAGAGNPGKSQ